MDDSEIECGWLDYKLDSFGYNTVWNYLGISSDEYMASVANRGDDWDSLYEAREADKVIYYG